MPDKYYKVATDIVFGREAREKLLAGVNIMADAVSSTLGPRGQNVAIAKYVPTGEIYDRVTLHDGVSVARSIILKDEFENMGAQLLKEASQKQVDLVGDGTTAVMILARAIITECLQLIAAGINPMSLRKGLEDSLEILVSELEKLATPVKNDKELEFVASISAGDKQLGGLIASAFKKVGIEGVVTAEESKSPDTVLDFQEGMQLDQGFMHPFLVTNPDRMESVIRDAYFLITDKSITSLIPFTEFFKDFLKRSKNLVIISPDISGEALPLLIQNKMQGIFNLNLIKAPSFGQDQKDILLDIAILTGAKYISEDAGYKFEDVTVDDLGFAESVTSTQNESIIVKGRGTKENINKRIAQIRKTLQGDASDFDKERMRARLGKLTNGVSIIRVGGQTEIEMKERRERVLDSIGATRAAMEKGIVAGGEVVYLHIRKLLGDTTTDKILYNALYQPFLKLITNAGLAETDMAIALKGKSPNYGIDVTTGVCKDLIRAGIVDPVLVPIYALQNAVSVALQIIMSGVIIVPEGGQNVSS